MSKRLEIAVQDAPLVLEWFENQGGAASWSSRHFAFAGQAWTTPARALDGGPPRKPHWSTGETPDLVVTDPTQVLILTPRVVQRFHVATEIQQGLYLKVTEGSSRRVQARVERIARKYGSAWHRFDHTVWHNCVILTADQVVTLAEYAAAQARKHPASTVV